MPTRPFLVLPGGDCVPLEGDWRIARLRGDWYVLGHNTVVPCDSKGAAEHRLAELVSQTDVDRLALEAIEALGRGVWSPDEPEEMDGLDLSR